VGVGGSSGGDGGSEYQNGMARAISRNEPQAN
jgi:hypothetical protein